MSETKWAKVEGYLVAIEGPDRAGKTTAAKRLAGETGAKYMKLPNRQRGMTGKLLTEFIAGDFQFSSDHETNERAAQLVFAANILEHRDELLDDLNSGVNLVVDRYVPSGVVYHSQAVGRDESKFILGLDKGMPVPDLVVVFEVDPEIAAQREEFGKDRNDNVELQREVGQKFREFFAESKIHPTVFIDASLSKDEVYQKLKQEVEKLEKEPRRPRSYY